MGDTTCRGSEHPLLPFHITWVPSSQDIRSEHVAAGTSAATAALCRWLNYDCRKLYEVWQRSRAMPAAEPALSGLPLLEASKGSLRNCSQEQQHGAQVF